MKMRNVLEGIGAALLLLPYYVLFISSSNLSLYHHGLPVTNLIGGYIVDLLGVAILVLCFLVAVQYLPAAIHIILCALFSGFLLWRIADVVILFLPNKIFWRGSVRNQSCIAILLLSGLMAYFLPRITQPAIRVVRLVIAAVAFSALWIIPQLLHIALVRQPVQSAAPSHLSAFTSSGSNRHIIWILFDELSYDQTFDHPAHGMKLPNFDRLHTESVSFSNLKPAENATQLIVPSLFLGRRIDRIRSTVNGDLWYKDESEHRWLAFDPNATLFGIAQRNGWSTGIDGWYIPYCHILAPVLNTCSWDNYAILPTEEYGASEEMSVLANAAVLPNMYLAILTNRPPAANKTHITTYRNVMARTHALIENGQLRFVFLHLPVPHPPGIYDRERHILRPGGTYLDNLVLADDTLGSLLQEINATPSASHTTVIVSSDHSWRILAWRHAEFWSDEDGRASGGYFDDRPVLLIHFPGQKSGNDVNAALSELLEHDIIAGMLLGKINNPEDLAAFLAQHGR